MENFSVNLINAEFRHVAQTAEGINESKQKLSSTCWSLTSDTIYHVFGPIAAR